MSRKPAEQSLPEPAMQTIHFGIDLEIDLHHGDGSQPKLTMTYSLSPAHKAGLFCSVQYHKPFGRVSMKLQMLWLTCNIRTEHGSRFVGATSGNALPGARNYYPAAD